MKQLTGRITPAEQRTGTAHAGWGGNERITQTEIGTCWWKLILKGWYLLWEAEKDVHVYAMNTDLVSMGTGYGIRNGLGYWRWSWKGLRSRPGQPLHCIQTRPTSCHRCVLRNNPFIRPMSSWVNCPNQAGKACRTRDTTTAFTAKPCSSNPACFSLFSK